MEKFLKACLLLMAVAVYRPVSAQDDYAAWFGQLTVPEFEESETLKERGTDAVVIYRNGHYSFPDDEDFMAGVEPFPIFRNEFLTRIKILTPQGERYATFEFPYENFSYHAALFTVEGYTYNMDENGVMTATPLGKNDVEDIQVEGDNYIRRIVFPNVRPGSVVELRCILLSKHTRMPEWRFQQDIPVLSSELVYLTNPYVGFSTRLKGAAKYTYSDRRIIKGGQRAAYETEPDMTRFVYGMRNLPAFPSEDYTNNAEDALVRIVFSYISKVSPRSGGVVSNVWTWEELTDRMSKEPNFGKYVRNAGKEYKKIEALSSDKSPLGIGTALYNYVRDNYRWDGKRSLYASRRVSELVKRKSGNSADINLFLAGLLRAAGIEAVPVAISTRNHGSIDKDFPTDEIFDYVVVMVKADGAEYFLDATERYGVFGELPARSSNVEGLVVEPDTQTWVFTVQDQFSFDERIAEAALDVPNGTMKVSVTRNFEGDAALNLRNDLVGNTLTASDIACDGGNVAASGAVVENVTEAELPLVVKYEYVQTVDVAPDGSVTIEPLRLLAPAQNPFPATRTRRFPVDMPFRPWDSYKMRIAIPDGYQVTSLPESVTVNDDVSFSSYRATCQDGVVEVEVKYYLMAARYSSSGYAMLQQRYDDVFSAMARNIILTKIPSES